MIDFGHLHHFLDISVVCSSNGLFLSQCQYAIDLLQQAGMAECHSMTTPVDTKLKLSATDGAHVDDPSTYTSLIDAFAVPHADSPQLGICGPAGMPLHA